MDADTLEGTWMERDARYRDIFRDLTRDEIEAVRVWRMKEARQVGSQDLLVMARTWEQPRRDFR